MTVPPEVAFLVAGAINVRIISDHWSELLRVAMSIKTGTVTASVILRKLAAYPRQNGLAIALRELGKLERTFFTLQWLQDPELRRRSHVGLNKGEQQNALRRAVYENSPKNLILKAICTRAGLVVRDIERGVGTAEQLRKFRMASEELQPAFALLELVEGNMSLQLAEIRARVLKAQQSQRSPCLVVFDYLQRAAPAQGQKEARMNRHGPRVRGPQETMKRW
jgi:hypothetical protein